MSLASRVDEAAQPVSCGPRCAVDILLPTLSQEDADALLALIYTRLDLPGTRVEAILREEGITGISYQTVNRHRRDLCHTCRARR